ncbi:uncharacterized protein dlgap2a isoform X1 [Gouania willdenowi]|uniref:uncharacterized protein dlgap2a isoform X1 n=1 Tax=Gouania willdenowi TaxID=441366 RepID=UPI001055474E|nr:uncharacterized protein LOC114456896 isoform X1 [Gouania willdenowi]
MSQMSETEINGQFESVCESVFSEMESQAMEALDLPGCFRTRSHSYLRAIQAGYSQDDECIPQSSPMSHPTIRSTTDRNYVQEDSCLPNQTSVHEDVADTAPMTHDDLGCPIRRDRLYHQEALGATAKPMSGPPVSPSLFRSPRSSAPERPSPKAIQASIKESATLAAAISMQWKEEVSAMRRELADLRRDLCKELRAFNSNFNTFTQHYNTWSPQGGSIVAGTSVGGGAGIGSGTGMGTKSGTEDRPAAGTGQPGTSTSDRGSTGAREKRPVVPKISVGTQARSKVLVRQSTADAAVNCPEEKEERKGPRRGLPKQLSMDPSILASPQSMYVESAIPLSLDPILPGSIKAHQSMPLEPTDAPAVVKLPPESECQSRAIQSLSDLASSDPVTPQTTTNLFMETNVKTKTNQENLPSGVNTSSNLDPHFNTEQANPEETPILHQTDVNKMQLPFPVPLLTVSPPEDQDEECLSDSESTDPVTTNNTCQDSQDPKTVDTGSTDKDCTDLTQSESKPFRSDTTVQQSQPLVCESSTPVLDPSTLSNPETEITCPSIIVSEYFDPEPPMSPNEIDTNQDLVENLPDYASDLPLETSVSACSSTLVETESNTEAETQDTEWPPLPEPQDTAPIYHADLIHFDLVMLTSLDQDDLDSVFMDPEPEPFGFSIESSSNTDELDPPLYHSPLSHSDSQSSPLPSVDPALMSPLTPSPDLVCLDPAMEYSLAHMPHDGASELPQITVTISPPSSVSPDTSFEISTGSAPDSPIPDTDPLLPDLQDPMSGQQALVEPENIVVKTLECATISQETVGTHGNQEGSSNEEAFLWCRWQRRGQRQDSMHRSASVELWSGRYEYNSAEITYVSLTL